MNTENTDAGKRMTQHKETTARDESSVFPSTTFDWLRANMRKIVGKKIEKSSFVVSRLDRPEQIEDFTLSFQLCFNGFFCFYFVVACAVCLLKKAFAFYRSSCIFLSHLRSAHVHLFVDFSSK